MVATLTLYTFNRNLEVEGKILNLGQAWWD